MVVPSESCKAACNACVSQPEKKRRLPGAHLYTAVWGPHTKETSRKKIYIYIYIALKKRALYKRVPGKGIEFFIHIPFAPNIPLR